MLDIETMRGLLLLQNLLSGYTTRTHTYISARLLHADGPLKRSAISAHVAVGVIFSNQYLMVST